MERSHTDPRMAYLAVLASLLVLTLVTVYVAFLDLGVFNTIVAMTIACTKSLLVVLYFMHGRHASRLIWVMIGSAILWLLVLFVLIMVDYIGRGWQF